MSTNHMQLMPVEVAAIFTGQTVEQLTAEIERGELLAVDRGGRTWCWLDCSREFQRAESDASARRERHQADRRAEQRKREAEEQERTAREQRKRELLRAEEAEKRGEVFAALRRREAEEAHRAHTAELARQAAVKKAQADEDAALLEEARRERAGVRA